MSEYENKNEASIGRLEEVDSPDDDSDDSFNLLFSVLVAETGTNEIENEFNEAVMEIEGTKSFECEKCGGLTKHTNSKHADPNVTHKDNLDKDTVDGFVEEIKARIIDEGLYDNKTTTALKAVKTTEALFTALLPIYETFCNKKESRQVARNLLWLNSSIGRVVEM